MYRCVLVVQIDQAVPRRRRKRRKKEKEEESFLK